MKNVFLLALLIFSLNAMSASETIYKCVSTSKAKNEERIINYLKVVQKKFIGGFFQFHSHYDSFEQAEKYNLRDLKLMNTSKSLACVSKSISILLEKEETSICLDESLANGEFSGFMVYVYNQGDVVKHSINRHNEIYFCEQINL